jgi:hypothetical protein
VLASGALRVQGREPRGAAERPTVSGRAAGRWGKKQGRGRRGKEDADVRAPVGRGRRRERGWWRTGWGTGLARLPGRAWKRREGGPRERERERGVGRRGPCGRKEGEGESRAEPKGLGLLSSFLLFLFPFYTQIIQTKLYEFK